VFPHWSDEQLSEALSRGAAQKRTIAQTIEEELAKHPGMAIGAELMREIDPTSAQDLKDVSAVVDKAIFGNAPAAASSSSSGSDSDARRDEADDGEGAQDSEEAAPLVAAPGTPLADAVAPPTPSSSSSSSSSTSSSSSSSSSGSAGEQAVASSRSRAQGALWQAVSGGTARGTAASRGYKTPEVLKQFVADESQALWLDNRENRFKAHDRREAPAHTEFSQHTFSRSYGQGRTHREALSLVVAWLHARHTLLTGDVGPFTQLPPAGEESPDLAAVLQTAVAEGYYKR
jgi:hypothetical protein